MLYPQQQAYKDARAEYERLLAVSGERQNTILDEWVGSLKSDEEIERYCEIAARMEFEIGLPQASQAYREAEKALLEWGLDYCRTHTDYLPVIGIVEKLLETPFLEYRKRACETLLRLGLFDNCGPQSGRKR